MNAQLYEGSLAYGDTLSLINSNVPGSSDCSVDHSIPINVGSYKSHFISLSTALRNFPATGSVSSNYGKLFQFHYKLTLYQEL